ncbi:MAG: response regulator [Bacteroidales bacterium]|nr:response regulator [Bacteroidales bacterium]
MSINVTIVEDHDDIRNRLEELIHSNFNLAGSYSNAEDFLSELPFVKNQVVFMDIHLPGLTGIEAIILARRKYPQIQFIVYTIFETDEIVFEAIKAGATGYLLKSSSGEKIIESVHQIIRGESPMSGIIAMKVVKAMQNTNPQLHNQTLSARENEILNKLSKGYRYKEIANQLFISVETVRTHIRNIYEKLQVNSKTEALNKINESSKKTGERYLNSSVKPEDEEICFQKINQLMETEKPYLLEKITISKLAELAGWPVYVVSQTINRKFNMGFFDLINQYRINLALELLKTNRKNYTIEGVAFQSGFSSKTAFYNAFKKQTGMSPLEFLNKTT